MPPSLHQPPRLGPHVQAPLAAFTLVLLLSACDASNPLVCRDEADTRVLADAKERFNQAQRAVIQLRMLGSPYVEAKIGPPPDFELGRDAMRIVTAARKARAELDEARERCGGAPL